MVDSIVHIWLQIFLGNIDRNTVRVIDLVPAVQSQKIRVNPQSWSGGNISMRLELSGCSDVRQLFCKFLFCIFTKQFGSICLSMQTVRWTHQTALE